MGEKQIDAQKVAVRLAKLEPEVNADARPIVRAALDRVAKNLPKKARDFLKMIEAVKNR